MDYKSIFTAPYDRRSWQELLHDIFLSKVTFAEQPWQVPVDASLAAAAYQLGVITLSDIHRLAVYEVALTTKVDIAHNRRGIRDLFTADWRQKGYVGAFVIAYRAQESSLRFSYVSETWGFNDRGEYAKIATATKRYTYLLGAEQACRTAEQQFERLKNSNKTLADITAAFSVEALSQEFFRKYEAFYKQFVQHMMTTEQIRAAFVGNIEGLSAEEQETAAKPVRDYVKRLLGRIVFLHFLQKKGWLGVPKGKEWGEGDRDFLRHLFTNASASQQATFLDQVLEPLFHGALDSDRSNNSDLFDTGVPKIGTVRIPYLNGGLFERDAYDAKPCAFPSTFFGELLATLAEYNFTIDENDPDDAEVGIDPEMLGRIFESLLEDNKDKGAYYTPKEIVQYMCRESLIAYLEGQLPAVEQGALRQFVEHHATVSLTDEQKKQIATLLRTVKICDPAIGSGAFPMGLLKELYRCRTALSDTAANSAAIKRAIIQQNIYGVDIERGAVEIARLRFWLALVVDEESPATLPNLDFKIMQGNSLLEQYHGIDLSRIANEDDRGEIIFNTDTCSRALVQEHLRRYFSCDDHDERRQLRAKINAAVRELIVGNYDSLRTQVQELDVQATAAFFLWHTWFADVFDKGGFDIVIGNPPYISLQNNQGAVGAPYQNAGYATFVKTGDIYCLFYERGLKLLKAGGVLCLITSNKWLRAGYGEKLRGYLAKESNPQLLVDFSGTRLFANATVDTNILLATKGDNEGATLCTTFGGRRLTTSKNIAATVAETSTLNTFPDSAAWVLLTAEEQALKAKIEKVGTPLSEWDISINYGIKTGCNEAFIITSAKREALLAACHDDNERQRTDRLLRPLLRGRDIKRYGYQWAHLWLIATFPARHYDIDDYPAVRDYLLSFGRERLEQTGKTYIVGGKKVKARKKTSNKWFEVQDTIAYWQEFAKPKIMYPNMTKFLPFCLDDKGFMTNQKCFFITGKHLSYLTAFLNSSIFKCCFRNNFPTLGNKGRELSKIFFDDIPVQQVSDAVAATFEKPVADIQRAYTADKARHIDEMLFALYHLTAEEVAYIRAAEEGE